MTPIPVGQEEIPFLQVKDLSVSFGGQGVLGGGRALKILRNVTFSVPRASCFAIVGESGSGKTTLARAIVGLIQASEGEIRLDGKTISNLSASETRHLRRRVQLILQDPRASMDPRMRVHDVLREALIVHGISRVREDQNQRIAKVIRQVGLHTDHLDRYAHEMSGGQRQRVAIARAIICEPEMLILDEPVSALDVSIQAQIINLLADLQESLGLTYLLISHDLALVGNFADKSAIMYLGRIVELGDTVTVCKAPQHPYAESLLALVASEDPVFEKQREIRVLEGNPPSPLSVPSGCAFHTRCPKAFEIATRLPENQQVSTAEGRRPRRCVEESPAFRNCGDGWVACHFPNQAGLPEPSAAPDMTTGRARSQEIA